eukprot:COSAG01_NODE_819_length_13340_cov_133.198172_20_plen_63_part_00
MYTKIRSERVTFFTGWRRRVESTSQTSRVDLIQVPRFSRDVLIMKFPVCVISEISDLALDDY